MFKNRLGLKVISLIGFFLLFSSIAIGYFFYFSEKNILLNSLSKRIEASEEIIESTLYYHIMPLRDFNKFKSFYTELNQLKDIYMVHIIRGNSVVRQYGEREDSRASKKEEFKALKGEKVSHIINIDGRKIMEVIIPLRAKQRCLNCHYVIEDEILGAISISFEIDKILNTIKKRKNFFLLSFSGITVFTILFISLTLRKNVLKPVYELVRGYDEVSRGNFNIKLKVRSRDEIGMLTHSFNEMVKNLSINQRALIQSEKLASIGTLTAEVAHRINNPLAIIRIRAEHMLDLIKDDKMLKKDIAVIMKNVETITKTVSDLLKISRTTKDDFREVSVKNVIKETVEFAEKIALKKNIAITVGDCFPSPVLKCNYDDLQYVFLSMIFNAFDALEKNDKIRKKLIKVNISSNKEENICEISISDNGCGIAPEHINRIFDPFFTTKEKDKGTGLGLSTAYNIIKTMGGRIWVESKVGEGTTFYIKVPVVKYEEDLK